MIPTIPRRRRHPFIVVAACALAGCTTYSFKVDAVRNAESETPGRSYDVVNGNPELPDGAPAVRQAADYVKTALSSKGLYEAPEGIPPEMIVEVDFGVEAPKRERRTYMVPVYRTVRDPGRTVTYTVTDKDGRTRTITNHIPGGSRQVLAGWRERVEIVIIYPKYLRITARESPEQDDDRPPRELWSVYVTNADESADLDEYLPLLVSAAMDSIDQNSSSAKTVVLSESDDRVTFVKRGM